MLKLRVAIYIFWIPMICVIRISNHIPYNISCPNLIKLQPNREPQWLVYINVPSFKKSSYELVIMCMCRFSIADIIKMWYDLVTGVTMTPSRHGKSVTVTYCHSKSIFLPAAKLSGLREHITLCFRASVVCPSSAYVITFLISFGWVS